VNRFLHWLWTTSLFVFCGYLAYWFSDPFWLFVIGLWPCLGDLSLMLGDTLTCIVIVPPDTDLWPSFKRITRSFLVMFDRAFWVGWFAGFCLLLLFVYLPLKNVWTRRGSRQGAIGWRRIIFIIRDRH
jgi:hypothetical protein